MLSPKRPAVVITSAVAALFLLSACSSLSVSATAQPTSTLTLTPGPAQTGAASEEFGSGCASVPTDPSDPASFEAMAQQPVGTAAAASPMLSTLVTALTKAGLVDALNNAENITVFAPTNDAFAKIAKEDLEVILADQDTLQQILTYHVVPETLTPDNLAGTHMTAQGSDLTVTGSGEDFTVNGTAKVVCGNVKTANATVYLVDGIILPE